MEPQGSSTPNFGVLKISSRRSIHEDVISPVRKLSSKLNKMNKSNQDEDSNHEGIDKVEISEEEINSYDWYTEAERLHAQMYNYCKTYKDEISNFLFYAIIVLYVFSSFGHTKNTADVTLQNLVSKFPNQDQNLWLCVVSSILEVERFNKPSVVILLYLEGSEETMEELVEDISAYAFSKLNSNRDGSAIMLRGQQLNKEAYEVDYGLVIQDYGPLLEKQSVMVVKNLDNVRPKVAQAFHSICDEHTPLVSKSFFIFTVKVAGYVGKDIEQVSKILREQWKNLDGDILEALITRVSNMVVRLKPES